MSDLQSRRALVLAIAGVPAAALLAGCDKQQTDAIIAAEQQAEAIIQKVQAGVVAACASFGKWVPTVTSVVAEILALTGAAGIASTTEAVVDAVITNLAAACQQAPPAPMPSPVPSPVPTPAMPAFKTAKGTSVIFY